MRLILAICVAMALVSACGGDDDAETPTPSGDTVDGIEVSISARDNTFSTDEIQVASGEHVIIHFTNNEATPHNVAFYETDAAEAEIYVGETIRGPGKTTDYEFDAPADAGTYFFRCDVHPVVMTGDLIVE